MAQRKTQLQKLARRLANGKNLTVNEAKTRFGVQRLGARIHELRENLGLAIFTNKVTNSKTGRKVTAYRMQEKFAKQALQYADSEI